MVSGCRATNKDGGPCSAKPVRADGWCYWHSPGLEAERQENRRKGGRMRSNQARARKQVVDGLMTVDELRGVLGTTITKALNNEIEPGVANAVANLARAFGSLTEAAKAEALAERLDELEALARRGAGA